MEVEEEDDFSSFTAVFPPNSVNVISAPTSSGKTHLVLQILKNRQLYFPREFTSVIVVQCNSNVDCSVYNEAATEAGLDLQIFSLEEFDVEEYLSEKSLLIFEDVQFVNNKITSCVNVHAHHFDLESVFIVCQSLIGTQDLFRLISLAHRVVLFFSTGSARRSSGYIVSQFFQDNEIKLYLKEIESYAGRNGNILLLEVNQLNGKNRTKYLAISGLENMSDLTMKPVTYFPHYNQKRKFEEAFGDNETEVDFDPDDLLDTSFLLVPARNVRKRSNGGEGGSAGGRGADKKSRWTMMSESLKEAIEMSTTAKKRFPMTVMVRSILSVPFFELTENGSHFQLEDQPATKVNTLDFAALATRQSGPGEKKFDPLFVRMTKMMLAKGVPATYFKNKALVQAASRFRIRRPIKQRRKKVTVGKKKASRKTVPKKRRRRQLRSVSPVDSQP